MSSFARMLTVVVISVIAIGLATVLAGFHNLLVIGLVAGINGLGIRLGYQIGVKEGNGNRS